MLGVEIMFQGMEYIYTVYKEKSFSKAAKKLFISQPSLSATVKRDVYKRQPQMMLLSQVYERL